jgi:Domain of unknown function (DUF4193)
VVTDTRTAPAEPRFTEGEPDLEPPEELAIAELDEQAVLEEELDNDDVDEQDVDDDVLQDALEDLTHAGDELAEGDLEAGAESDVLDSLDAASDQDDVDRALSARDHEEGLDVVLLERLALLDPPGPADGDADGDMDAAEAGRPVPVMEAGADILDLVEVAPCGHGEFVCRSCFLVRTRAQLADGRTMTCRDCSA